MSDASIYAFSVLAILTVAGGVGIWKYLTYLYHKEEDDD